MTTTFVKKEVGIEARQRQSQPFPQPVLQTTPCMQRQRSARNGVQRPSLTIFTIPKPFVGHIGVIQRNAIVSWAKLIPSCEIILCGNEAGTAEIAAELGLLHVPDLARNEYGTPFLHSAFQMARERSSRELLCYINCDIILLDDFVQGLVRVKSGRFLMVGRRWDFDLTEPWNFEQPNWQESLRSEVEHRAVPHSMWGIDYFVFPRHGVLDRLPPFVVGRPGWDNWVIYNARKRGVPVIDASPTIKAIHQNHDYRHVPMRTGEKWVGPESHRQINLLHDLMEGGTLRFSILDATHTLTPQGPQRTRSLRSLRRSWETLGVLHPNFKHVVTAFNPLVALVDWIWQKRHLRRGPNHGGISV